MILDLLMKFVVTPENVLGLVWTVVTVGCMCLIFCAWKEKWWKSLIPFYGKYLIYKHTWNKWKWLFLVEVLLDTVGAKSVSFMKKHVMNNAISSAQTYIETKQLDVDISVEQLVLSFVLFLISTIIVFVLKRVTYVKVCGSLGIHSMLLKIGTFIFPELFLIIDYICYKRMERKTHEFN